MANEQWYDSIQQSINTVNAKVDRMAEAFTTLARMDEKYLAQQQILDRQADRQDKQGAAIDEIMVTLAGMQKTSSTNEWFVRLLIAAMVGTIAYLLRG